MSRSKFTGIASVLFGLLVISACSDSTGTGDARLSVRITDAPSDYFDSAVVYIGEVAIIPDEGEPVIVSEEGGRFDLLDLQNGVTASLGELDIEPGDYLQLRLIVDSAYVGLAGDLEFNDGTTERSLRVPSGAQTGIKINLDAADGDDQNPGVTIAAGETVLVVDFDVEKNFVFQGNPDTPAGLNGVMFTPTLRAVVTDIAGSISGTVLDGGGSPVVGATVLADLTTSEALEALQTTEASAVTDSAGAYTVMFLAPGEYDVRAAFGSDTTTAAAVEVGESEDVEGVDFTI